MQVSFTNVCRPHETVERQQTMSVAGYITVAKYWFGSSVVRFLHVEIIDRQQVWIQTHYDKRDGARFLFRSLQPSFGGILSDRLLGLLPLIERPCKRSMASLHLIWSARVYWAISNTGRLGADKGDRGDGVQEWSRARITLKIQSEEYYGLCECHSGFWRANVFSRLKYVRRYWKREGDFNTRWDDADREKIWHLRTANGAKDSTV